MPNNGTPAYISTLLMPRANAKQQARRVWSMDLQDVIVPLLTATNTTGETAIPHDALGAPIRLAYNKDGSVKFSASGKPTTRVAKPISDAVSLIRENFVASLRDTTRRVMEEHPDEYAHQVALAKAAGTPIVKADAEALSKAYEAKLAEEVAEAQAKAEKQSEDVHTAPERELVPA